jgi:hypothetical protein
MSEWLFFNANPAIFQLYHGENKLIFKEMMTRSVLYYTNRLSWILIVLAHWSNRNQIDMSPYSDTVVSPLLKHAALKRKSKDWLAQSQDNVSEYGDMSIWFLLLQWASTIKVQLRLLVQYKEDLVIISLKINLFSPWYSWKIAWLALKNNHSLTFQKHCS